VHGWGRAAEEGEEREQDEEFGEFLAETDAANVVDEVVEGSAVEVERGETVLCHDEHEDWHDAEDAKDEGEAAEPPAAAGNAAEHDDG
jgi:hypothetical protein